jgi:hypothetical protein
VIACFVSGLKIFFEEDHYVAPDFLHMVKLLDQKCKTSPEMADMCDIMSLGTYVKNPSVPALAGLIGDAPLYVPTMDHNEAKAER